MLPSAIEPSVVPALEWGFVNLDSEAREKWLAVPIDPLALIAEVVGEARAEAARGAMKITMNKHREKGGRRVIVTFALSPRVFDQLFHGRSGYRAQYYLSVGAGRAYNRQLIDDLVPVVAEAFDDPEDKSGLWAEMKNSLAGSESKIWPMADALVFSRRCGRSLVRVARWEEYWTTHKPSREASGLFANIPSPAFIALKGTFFLCGEPQPAHKDRDAELHERGYT